MGTINLLLRVKKKKKKRDALVEVEEQGKESGMDVPDSGKTFPKALLTLPCSQSGLLDPMDSQRHSNEGIQAIGNISRSLKKTIICLKKKV